MMSDSLLAANMLNLFRANMQKMSPGAVPQPFQQVLCQAIAKGVITALSQAVAVALAPSPVVVGQGLGLTVEASLCKQAATVKLISYFGGKGAALDYILDAVYQSSCAHFLQFTDIISVSGFGGQAGPPQNVPGDLIANLILANLPAESQQQLASSQYGTYFIKGIAEGFSAGLLAGVPGIVPFGVSPPPPGLLIAKFQ
jgi:hypothetical protein